MTSKQLLYFEFTSWVTDKDEVIKDCEFVENYIFQQEACPTTGKLHFQGHVKLKLKKRLNEVKKIFTGVLKEARWKMTSNEGIKDNKAAFYCMKQETRVDGPWSDFVLESELRVKLPWDLEKIEIWKPWQNTLTESFDILDDRGINVLIDKVGGIGKSKIFKWCLWKKLAGVIPCIGDAKDIIQAVCCMGPKKAFILDLPRTGENEKKLYSQIMAIEQIKNGVVMDFRHSYRELIFGSPVIWIFTNDILPQKMLSKDRWIYWEVKDDVLKRYTGPL